MSAPLILADAEHVGLLAANSMRARPRPFFFTTAGAPDGAALAVARPTRRALRIAVWRPPA